VGGIAALLAAVVRAHLPALAIGLTGSFTLLLPMLSACFAAMLVPTLLRDPPIYDSLRDLTAPEHGNIRLFRRGSIDPR
jgi:CIC family chloride channel protein